MKERYLKIARFVLLASFLSIYLPVSAAPVPVLNYVASSTGYLIVEDAITSGVVNATSTTYGVDNSNLSGFSTEDSTSTSFILNSGQAGILQMSNSTISISTPSNVAMSPAIFTSGGGTGSGSATWTVTTNSSGGYSLSINAGTDPALVCTDCLSSSNFGNYSTHVDNTPDYYYLNEASGDYSNEAGLDSFGFTPRGGDISSVYKDDGNACNSGGSNVRSDGFDADHCWDYVSTDAKTVARGLTSNDPLGADTTVKFRAFAGQLVHKSAGSYSATITVTALAL